MDQCLINTLLDEMIVRDLAEFKEACFADDEPFKARLTVLLCSLYEQLPTSNSVRLWSAAFRRSNFGISSNQYRMEVFVVT